MTHTLRGLLRRLFARRAIPHRPAHAPAPPFMLGVNLCGAEFGVNLPGVHGQDYLYPAQLDYYHSKGLNLIRLPFRWERLQPELFARLDPTELDRLLAFVAGARCRGMKVIPEPHNFARYGGHVVGTPQVPRAALADLWGQLAEQLKGDPAVYACGLMNEPHDTAGLWPAAAQAAVDAIRSVDPATWVLVPGDGWSGAADWRKDNEHLWIEDPRHRVMYEAHVYFDRDKSGQYAHSYDADRASPTIGIDRLRPFRQWLDQRSAIGFVGEFGVPAGPDEDPRWLESLERFVAHLREIEMSGCYWAGGPWWGDDHLCIEPRNGEDRPQMKILERHTV